MATLKIQVVGLKEFRKALRDADSQLPRELRKVFNVAAQVVVAEAVPQMPQRTGNLAGSVRALSTQTEGRVVSGSARVPYAGFIEFGGTVGRGRTGPRTGSVHRPFVRGGRYLYPAFQRRAPQVQAAVQSGVDALARTIESG